MRHRSVLVGCIVWTATLFSQNEAAVPAVYVLRRVDTVKVPNEVTNTVANPLHCDEDGNLYVKIEYGGNGNISKFSPKGQKLATFSASTNTSFQKIDVAGYFTTSGDEVYQLVFPHELDRYVFNFKPDGTFNKAIKLSPGFPWVPSLVTVFPNEQFLVTGLEYDKKDVSGAKWPFTGMFSSDGSLLKEIKLEDDDTLHDMAANGDVRLTTPGMPGVNRAVSNGFVGVAGDGNAYLMRWTDPVIFYAISPGGQVVRKFTVDIGEHGYMPAGVHIAKNHIAILFFDPERWDQLIMKVIDLEGHRVGTYRQNPTDQNNPELRLSTAFACFLENPMRFVFAGASEENHLEFWVAEAK